MIFTSFTYLYFFLIVFILYWSIPKRAVQNSLLLIASYIFYGWVHPWFCILIAISTLVDYFAGLGMFYFPEKKKLFLILSIFSNLGMLFFFKYFNFFAENVQQLLSGFGLHISPFLLTVFLPVGISFYTFQTLSYTIDVYYGKLEARKNLIDFATFVALFPQLVAGPIERARNLLPQLEKERRLSWQLFDQGIPLLITGFFKKLIIADNIAVYVNQVYLYQNPPFILLLAGTMAFALQIFTDFSAYTDIARGSAKLLGLDLIENFNNPYMAISPSDFWRRWHISFSTFIRDYVYIPMGGSRVKSKLHFAWIALITFTLSGLWHGAAWNFVFWGIFHGIILFIYHLLQKGGKWKPFGFFNTIVAWAIMSALTLFGWFLFRTPNLSWLKDTILNISFSSSNLVKATAFEIFFMIALYSIPLLLITFINRVIPRYKTIHYILYGIALAVLFIFYSEQGQDFIYFRF